MVAGFEVSVSLQSGGVLGRRWDFLVIYSSSLSFSLFLSLAWREADDDGG